MALHLPLKPSVTPLPSTSSKPAPPILSVQYKLSPVSDCYACHLKIAKARNRALIPKAVEESQGSAESETVKEAESPETQPDETSGDLGAEIKKAMMERKEREGETSSLSLSGVAEEVREIEWPAFGKVLGLTGVVIGVIAGSSVVLLTVNFVLAELSDKVFAGRGVQDFFS